MTWFTPVFIGDVIFFACGCAVGHFGPKAIAQWFSKEVKKIKKKK